MANDRLIIRCDTCGGWKMLMKHFPGTLATRDNGILKWLDAHGDCHPNLYGGDLCGVTGFSLHTEAALEEGGELRHDRQNALPPNSKLTCPPRGQ